MIRVLVADDQQIVRAGLAALLDAQDDIAVVAAVSNGRDAVDEARRLRPDVCLLDIRMPLMDGVEATRRLAGPQVADPLVVVVITTFDSDEHVYAALAAGARGFLLKDAGPDLLAQAVRAAAAGDALIDPSVTVRLLDRFASTAPPTPAAPLTDRELAVLRLVASGRTNAEIATDLHLGASTVKTHLAAIMAKTDTRNRVEVARWAFQAGLLAED
ncbi:response regulator transcription factor [Nocardioides limicola]|uniref:response regulator transcription factor n=1 Tax=Nocardioides limicola TaxID=2803368 RepID=UPI00193C4451|nr:response regulator transcription factor [Nocardioides sp. DJM-14]